MHVTGWSVDTHRGVNVATVHFSDGYELRFYAHGILPHARTSLGYVTLRQRHGEIARYNVRETIGGGSDRLITGSAPQIGKYWRKAVEHLQVSWRCRDRCSGNTNLELVWSLAVGTLSTAEALEHTT